MTSTPAAGSLTGKGGAESSVVGDLLAQPGIARARKAPTNQTMNLAIASSIHRVTAEKRRSGEAEKRRSGEAEKRRSGEAEKASARLLLGNRDLKGELRGRLNSMLNAARREVKKNSLK